AGGGKVEPAGRLDVLLQAIALFVEAGESELGGSEAGVGSTLEPANRLWHALLNPASFGVTGAQLVFGGRIVRQGGGAQDRADRGGQRVDVGITGQRAAGCRGFRRHGLSWDRAGHVGQLDDGRRVEQRFASDGVGLLWVGRRWWRAFRRRHRSARRGRRGLRLRVGGSGALGLVLGRHLARGRCVRKQEFHGGL